MISQLQGQRVGIEVNLLAEVGLAVFPNIVVEKRHRNDNRDLAPVVCLNDVKELLLFIS